MKASLAISEKKYSHIILIGFFSIMAIIAALNWAIDPFDLFGGPLQQTLHIDRPQKYTHERLSKTQNAVHHHPELLILGTSRADTGLDPEKIQDLTGISGLNLGIPQQPPAESYMLMEHFPSVKNVLWAVDFFTFNCTRPLPPDMSASNLSQWQRWKLLLSYDMLEASAITLFKSADADTLPTWSRSGLRTPNIHTPEMAKTPHELAHNSELFSFINLYAQPFHTECSTIDLYNPMGDFRKAVRLSYERGIDLRLMINPLHARVEEGILDQKLWDEWENWKRGLMTVLTEEATASKRPPFPLWDFSGYTYITTYPFPSYGNILSDMPWYWESHHYKKEVGDLILETIYGRTPHNDIGVLLTEQSLEAHLAQIRQDRDSWRNQNPDIVKEIADEAREWNVKQ